MSHLSKSFLSATALIAVVGFANTAQADLPGWTYTGPVEVTENSGGNLTGIQVLITIDTQTLIQNGEMNADGSDLRFGYDCNGDDLIPYWIDEATLNTTSTDVWVVLDLQADETLFFYMFWGNQNAAPDTNIDIFDGPHSSIDSLMGGSTNNPPPNSRGFRFTPNQDLLVAQFGKNAPNAGTRWLTLWETAGQSQVHQQQVTGGGGMYSYADVPNPFWITQGTEHIMSIFQGNGDSYYFGVSSQVNSHLTYGSMRYCNSCTQNTYPTSNLNGYQYGYPDFNYYVRQQINNPPTQNQNAACINTNECDSDCSIVECGDGFYNDVAEECDDGNMVETDDCLNNCIAATCGDGFIWDGNEDCDDQNADNTDACVDCADAACGDGFLYDGVEECDDGNNDDNDGCAADCTIEAGGTTGTTGGVDTTGDTGVDTTAGDTTAGDTTGGDTTGGDTTGGDTSAGTSGTASATAGTTGDDTGSTSGASSTVGGTGGRGDDSGCGCTSSSNGQRAGFMMMALGLLGLWRPRRRRQ